MLVPGENALIVERVASGSLGKKATLQVGDRLLTYDGQALPSPAALLALEENTFGKESVLLVLQREGQSLEIVVPPGKLDIDTRPELDAELLTDYEVGRAAFETGRFVEASRQWSGLAEQVQDKHVTAWLWGKAGEAWEKVSDWPQALGVYRLAYRNLADSKDDASHSQVCFSIGRCHLKLSEYAEASEWFERACPMDERGTRPIWKTRSIDHLGVVAFNRGELPIAEGYFIQALEVREYLVPGSLDVAKSFNNLGTVAFSRGDLSLAQDYFRRALEIKERLAPGSLDVAKSFNNLGNVAAMRGDLSLAQDDYRRALEIWERLAPGSLEIALSFNNLGLVAYFRGDLSLAQDDYRRALEIRERLAPGSLDVAESFNNLGNVAYFRGDLSLAQDDYRRALEIKERLAPGSLDVAKSFNNLGSVAWKRGDLPLSQDYHWRALEIRERLAPNSLEVAETLNGLGSVAWKRGDLSLAQDYQNQALQIQEYLAPESLDYALTLNELGHLLLNKLQFIEARELFQKSVDILERQRSQIVSPDARALLLAQHTGKYAGLIQCHLALQQSQEAYSVLERARARSLSELLAEHRLDLTADAPPELLRQQQDLDQQRSAIYNQLAQSSATAEQEGAIQDLHRQLRDLERQQQDHTAAIRQASPHYASLQYPQPLDCQQAQAALDPGSLLLAYLVDEEQIFLFAVTAKSIEAFTLPVGREALQEQVRDFRRSLDIRRLEYNQREAIEQSHQLYVQLIAPAQAHIKRAKRLLFCSDGPLHSLPFAALVIKAGRKPHYLGIEKPLHSVVSMTVYAQVQQQHQAQTEPDHNQIDNALSKVADGAVQIVASTQRLLALGDPLYASVGFGHASAFARSGEMADRVSEGIPAEVEEAIAPGTEASAVHNAELAEMQTRGLSLSPLPHTRTEVESLAALFGDSARVKVGAEATKTAALAESREADILHFACHGWLDAQMPLSSRLILSQPEALGEQAIAGDNGMLQAWEIMQHMRLKADLVVLSACQTGLGQEIRGEGLIGLTRAFQYAGARSLVVSLWEVNDASTSHFMQAFYMALREGVSKDEALQAGVKALQADARWNHPYFWSAFVLVGDCN